MQTFSIAAAAALALAPPVGAPLTPDGLGAVRIGMSRAQVTRIVGPLEGEELTPGCVEMEAARGWRHIWFMFEEGRLTRISIGESNRARTPRGIGIGSTEAQVLRAYGRGLRAEPHTYQEPPARYFTYWVRPGSRGVRFETDASRRVQTIHAGGPSIEYVEGCL